MLLIADINNQYDSVNELMEKLIEVLNLEKIQIDKLFDKAEYCREHEFLIEAKYLQLQAQQKQGIYINLCNNILGIYV